MNTQTIDRYALYEHVFEVADAPQNGYRDVDAQAVLCSPSGREAGIPLFWDGKDRFVLRFSPDAEGLWSFAVASSLGALDGEKGSVECVASDRRGGIRVMPEFPYHFARQDGTPMWFFGDTAWRGFATDPGKNVTRETFEHYLDVRAAQGFNYISADVGGSGGIAGREAYFDSYHEEILRPDHFQEMDGRIRAANSRGITVGIVLAWHRGSPAWECFRSEAACLRYARYITARYSALDVVFIVSGEWDQIDPGKRPLFQRIGREIMEWDPHGRMRGIHPCKRRTVEEFAQDDWMSFGDYQQMYKAPHDREATAEERKELSEALRKTRVHGKPVVNAEYGYYLRRMAGPDDYRHQGGGVDKPHSHTRDSFRRASWALVMGGGYFVTGFGSTYFGGRRSVGLFDVDDRRYDDAEADLVRIKGFFGELAWWTLGPDDQADGDGFCYTLGGDGIRVVYAEGCRKVTVDAAEPQGVGCYDPRTGAWADAVVIHKDKRAEIACPDEQDWVFLLRSKAG